MSRRVGDSLELLGPIALVVAFAVIASLTANASDDVRFRAAIVYVAIVVALYVFVGNSGVLSFGQMSFVAVGAFASGLMTVPTDVKPGVMPSLFPFIRDHSISNPWSLVLAAALGGVYALLVGPALMRLTGLAAGIATFAVLGITYNILTYWTRIGPGAQTLDLIPVTTGYLQATGIDVHRQRLWAFVLSGTLCGFAGGLLVHLPPGSISTNDVYLDLTFLALAMLVVGGVHSLYGAVLGALGISLVNVLLQNAEASVHVFGWKITLPDGSAVIGIAVIMLLALLLRPSGITGGREFALPRRLRHGAPAPEPPPAAQEGV